MWDVEVGISLAFLLDMGLTFNTGRTLTLALGLAVGLALALALALALVLALTLALALALIRHDSLLDCKRAGSARAARDGRGGHANV